MFYVAVDFVLCPLDGVVLAVAATVARPELMASREIVVGRLCQTGLRQIVEEMRLGGAHAKSLK